MRRVGGANRLRLLRWQSEGLSENVRACRNNFALLGQERHFSERGSLLAVLKLIEVELGLDSITWRDQQGFFRELFESFFGNGENPAWITVHAARASFPQRMAVLRCEGAERPQVGKRLFRLEDIDSKRIILNDQRIPTVGMRLFHRWDVPDPQLAMQRLFLHRWLSGDGLGPPVVTTEEWLFAVSPDEDERRAVSQGLNLNLEEFRHQPSKMQTAPLVSLCRPVRGGVGMEIRVVCLRPFVGEVVDLRSVHYTSDYYFRSDQMNHSIIERLVTTGQYDLF
jgi:hypothetical protein